MASPIITGAHTPASLPKNTSTRAAGIRQARPGAPERITSRPRSAMELQKSNLTAGAEMAPGPANRRAAAS